MWLPALSPSGPQNIRLAELSLRNALFRMRHVCLLPVLHQRSMCDSLGNCSQDSVTRLRAVPEAGAGSAVKPGIGLRRGGGEFYGHKSLGSQGGVDRRKY